MVKPDGVASRPSDTVEVSQSAPASAVSAALTTRGTPRQRAPKGTFDRKKWQADAARRRRARLKAAKEAK